MVAFLKSLGLSDRYDLKARLLPALIVVLPLGCAVVPLIEFGSMGKLDKVLVVLIGSAIVLALSHAARAFGVRLEGHLIKENDGLPTMRWLRASDTSHSEQQKELWRKALSKFTQLELSKQHDATSERLSIQDAVLSARVKLRDSTRPSAKFLKVTVEEYGFARNFGGLAIPFVITSSLGLLTSIISAVTLQSAYWPIFATTACLLFSIFWLRGFKAHVLHCSDRYAEAFFAAVEANSKSKERSK